ncbi:MAG: sugar phosphate isomerase/epimerase [Ruminococcaceae bacterium]|nr:sugar phosphate isomerase/epimerase [Oscillospiraceae bacterium]
MATDLYLTAYSLKSINPSVEDGMRIAKEIGFDGMEGGSLTEEYLGLLEKYDLKCVNFSVTPTDSGEIRDEDLKLLEKYSSNRLVSIRMGDMSEFFKMLRAGGGYKGIPGAFGTFQDAIKAAEKANEAAAIAAKYGLKTFYHNHTHEYRVDHGEYVMDTYLRHCLENHVMEIDVGWVLTAGVDPIYWMQRWPGRIGCMHIKSCNWALNPEALGMSCPVPPLEVGISKDQQDIQQAYAEGPQGPMEKTIMSWRDIIAAAKGVGCDTFIIERERIYNDPQDIIACLQADHDHIRTCLD